MKDRLKRLLSFYLNSWWLPAFLFGGLALTTIVTNVAVKFCIIDASVFDPPRLAWLYSLLPNYPFIKGLAILSGVGFAASFIRHLIQNRGLKLLGGLAVLLGFFLLLCVTAFAMSLVFLPMVAEVIRSVEQAEKQPADESPTPEREETP